MSKSTIAKAFIASATAAVATFSLTPAARAQDAPRSAAVPHADLNLASATGRAMLGARIDMAAHAVCDNNGVVSLAERQDIANCIATTRFNAQRRAVDVIAQRTGDTRLAGVDATGIAGR